MMSRSQTMIHEERQNLRVKENLRILYGAKGAEGMSPGRVCDISASGMRMEMHAPSFLEDKSILSISSEAGGMDFIPGLGQLIWQRKKRFRKNRYLCGIKFMDTPENTSTRLRQRIQEHIHRLIAIRRISRVTGAVVLIAVAALTGYALWLFGIVYQGISSSNEQMLQSVDRQAVLTRNYQGLYQETNRKLLAATLELNQTNALYQESRQMLQAASAELRSVKAILTQTETMLAFAQRENLQLKQEIQTVSQLKDKDAHLADKVDGLQGQLDDFVHNRVKDVEAGRTWISFYHSRIKVVQSEIRQIKAKVRSARIAALRQRDRLRTMIGNNGYLTKDGQIVQVDRKQYEAMDMNPTEPVGMPQANKNVKVNVTVFQ